MIRSRLVLLTLPLLAACGGLDDSRFSTGSSTVVAASDYTTLHVVDADSGVVGSMDADGNELGRFELGGEPTRIARAGDKILVTQRTERTLAVLSETSSGLALDERILVGAEPMGVVAAEDGARAWVAASLSGTVVEIDMETLEVTRDWVVPGEPRWLALHPSQSAIFVGSAYGNEYHRIDLGTDEVQPIVFPSLTAEAFSDASLFDLTARATGDLAVSPNGKALAIPVLYVDNTTPVPPPGGDIEDLSGSGGGGYSANGGSRFNGTVAVLDLDHNGFVTDTQPEVVSLSGFVEGDDFDFTSVGGYGASVTWDTENENVFVTMEGASAVLRVQAFQENRFESPNTTSPVGVGREPVPFDGEDIGGMDGDFFVTGSFIPNEQLETHAVDSIATNAGPRGIAMLDGDSMFVHSFITRTLQKLPVEGLPERNLYGEEGDGTAGSGSSVGMDAMVEFVDGGGSLSAGVATELAPDVLPADIRAGRDLFYSTVDSRMSSPSASISCATCHLDGRTDGVTWTFVDEDLNEITLQTPSLAGVVSLTAPVTWIDSVETVADEAMITSQGRMGGDGLHANDAELVAAFIDWTREPDVKRAGSDSDAVARGEEIFHSEEVGCADCHTGEAWTDNEAYDMYGLDNVRTRSLVGISASAPYLHDGSSPTLKALMNRSKDGSMGDTSSLSDAQIDDLVAFLEAL